MRDRGRGQRETETERGRKTERGRETERDRDRERQRQREYILFYASSGVDTGAFHFLPSPMRN